MKSFVRLLASDPSLYRTIVENLIDVLGALQPASLSYTPIGGTETKDGLHQYHDQISNGSSGGLEQALHSIDALADQIINSDVAGDFWLQSRLNS
jgi:hypothetical protein